MMVISYIKIDGSCLFSIDVDDGNIIIPKHGESVSYNNDVFRVCDIMHIYNKEDNVINIHITLLESGSSFVKDEKKYDINNMPIMVTDGKEHDPD